MSERLRRERSEFRAFIILLLLPALTATSCSELQCLNSNPCQSVRSRDNTMHAQCVCGGKWAGPRCEHHLRLKIETLTSSDVTLNVDLLTSQNEEVTAPLTSQENVILASSGKEMLSVSYTLVFWRHNGNMTSASVDELLESLGKTSCVLLHKLNSKHPTLFSLSPRNRYTICVESGSIDSCILSSFTDSLSSSAYTSTSSGPNTSSSMMTSPWPSNCVTFITPSGVEMLTNHSVVTEVAVAVVLVSVVLVLLVIFFVAGRYSVAGGLLMDSVFYKCCCCCCCSKSDYCCGRESPDTTYLSRPISEPNRSTADETFLGPKTKKKTRLRRLRPSPKNYIASSSSVPDLHPQPREKAGRRIGLRWLRSIQKKKKAASSERTPERNATPSSVIQNLYSFSGMPELHPVSALPDNSDYSNESAPLDSTLNQENFSVSRPTAEQETTFPLDYQANERGRYKLPRRRKRRSCVTYCSALKGDKQIQLSPVLEFKEEEEVEDEEEEEEDGVGLLEDVQSSQL